MSEAKFTPGPWHVVDNGLCVCDRNRVVLFLSDRPYGDETDRADTNLVAAAPEMYEALSRACSLCKTRRITNKSICDACYTHKALRKARGESEVSE